MIYNKPEGGSFRSGINIHRKNYGNIPMWRRPIKGITVVFGNHAMGFMKIFPKKNNKKGWGWVHLCRWYGHPWEKVKAGEISCP